MWVKQQNATSPSVPQQMAAENGTLMEFYILITLFGQSICGGPIKIYCPTDIPSVCCRLL